MDEQLRITKSDLLRELLFDSELLGIIENALVTRLEGFVEDVTPLEEIDLSDYEECEDE